MSQRRQKLDNYQNPSVVDVLLNVPRPQGPRISLPHLKLELSGRPKTGEFFQKLHSFNPERWWAE